jgi:hypothetical protein
MNTIASRLVARSPATALQRIRTRVWVRSRVAFRRLAVLYAEGRIRQAALEVRRFEQRHRSLARRLDAPRSRPAEDARHSFS